MRYNVIAIEREYASGGREVGEKLAAKLGIPCYSQEILEKAAAKLGLSHDELRNLEESITGNLLFSMNMLGSLVSGKTGDLTSVQKLAIAEADVVHEVSLNPCVIVGRSAAGLLKDNGNSLKVFIHSDFSARIERAAEVYKIEPKLVESVLRRFDKRRANYFKTVTGLDWEDGDTYHMVFNSGKLGIDQIVDILYAAAK